MSSRNTDDLQTKEKAKQQQNKSCFYLLGGFMTFPFQFTDLVDFLLSRGAHPDVQDKGGHTSVMLAAKLGSDDIVTRLTQSQADMRIVDSAGKGIGPSH